MRNKITAALLGLSIILGGCSSKEDEIYQSSIEKGLDAVTEENFNKAEGLFEVALDAKEDDVKVKAYINQVKLILEANKLVNENKYKKLFSPLINRLKLNKVPKSYQEYQRIK